MPNRAAAIEQGALEQQIARAVRRQVVLLGVVIQVLIAVGEVEAGHAAFGALPVQVELGEVLGQMAPDGAEDPIQRSVPSQTGPFVGEVPDVLAPTLQLDEGQPAPSPSAISTMPAWTAEPSASVGEAAS